MEAKGKADGKYERNLEIAKKMIAQDYSISDISYITSLSADEIEKLRKEPTIL